MQNMQIHRDVLFTQPPARATKLLVPTPQGRRPIDLCIYCIFIAYLLPIFVAFFWHIFCIFFAYNLHICYVQVYLMAYFLHI